MGKNKKFNANGKNEGTKSKRRKLNPRPRQRFWIEQCKTRKLPKKLSPESVLKIFISRVELIDDHGSETKHKFDSSESQNEEHAHGSLVDDADGNTTVVDKEENGEESLETYQSVTNEQGETENLSKEEEQGDDAAVIDVELKRTQSRYETQNNEDVKQINQTNNKEHEERTPFMQVIRLPSSKGNLKKPPDLFHFLELPNGDCGDGIVNPYPKDEVPDKYWAQRKRLFSKFEEGIQLDKESWYSVTPEAISRHVAKRVSNQLVGGHSNTVEKIVVLDAFCGVGGNAIGFALREEVSLVVCVDIDRKKLIMAAKNASVYGIDPSKIVLVASDATEVLGLYRDGKLLEKLLQHDDLTSQDKTSRDGYTIHGLEALPSHIDCVFLSPPWGGTDYLTSGSNTLSYKLSGIKIMCSKGNMEDSSMRDHECSGGELLSAAAQASNNKAVVCFLPRNIDGFDVAKCAWMAGYRSNSHIELEQNILNAKLKAVTVYLF